MSSENKPLPKSSSPTGSLQANLAEQFKTSIKRQRAAWSHSHDSKQSQQGYLALSSVCLGLDPHEIRALWREEENPVECMIEEHPSLRVYTGKTIDVRELLFDPEKSAIVRYFLEIYGRSLQHRLSGLVVAFPATRRGWWLLETQDKAVRACSHVVVYLKEVTVVAISVSGISASMQARISNEGE